MKSKSHRILSIVKHFQTKYGVDNVFVRDHWEADEEAIGLTEKSGLYLAYISTIINVDNYYYLALENPPINGDFPYSSAGKFDHLSLSELENIVSKHLRLLSNNHVTSCIFYYLNLLQ